MADEKRKGPGRRPPPTIDLKAAETGGRDEKVNPTRDFIDAAEKDARHARWYMPSAGQFTAGFIGGAVVALVLFAMWLSGTVPIRYAGSNAMRTRIAAVETQLQDVAGKVAAPADTRSTDELRDRLARLEQAVSKIPAPDASLSERLAALENAVKATGVALAALNSRIEDAAVAKVNVEPLQKRIDALETASQQANDKIAKNSGADTAARSALAAVALRDAVARGEEYGAQLAAVKSTADEKQVSALEPFAASGVPSNAALSAELGKLLPQMFEAMKIAPAQAGSFIDRLQANAGKLVRVRPADAPEGDEPAAAMARIEVAVARQDVSAARADLMKLPEKARVLADGWLKKVEARRAANDAASAILAAATGALGKP